MSPESFRFVLEGCTLGTEVELECSGVHGASHCTGVLLHFDGDGIFVQCDGVREFISREIVLRLRVRSRGATLYKTDVEPLAATGDKSEDQASDATRITKLALEGTVLEEQPSVGEIAPSTSASMSGHPRTDPQWQLLFGGEPQLAPPDPNLM